MLVHPPGHRAARPGHHRGLHARASPALAGHLRDRLAAALPANIEEVADELAAQRRQIKADGGSTEDYDWKARIVEVFERFAG